MNIVLIGFMGTGKSAVGLALARRLNVPFLDTDAEVEREAGKPIRQIFAEDGEPAFRAMETALLAQLASSPAPPALGAGGRSLILATGGGTPLRDENARLLRRIGPVVWLTAPAATILQRVGPDLSLRPLLADFQNDPLTRIESLLISRAAHYAAIATLTCDTSPFVTPEEVAAFLVNELCQPAVKPSLRVSDRKRPDARP